MNGKEFKVGDRVISDTFGEGTIIDGFKTTPFGFADAAYAVEVAFDNGELHYFSLKGECLWFAGVDDQGGTEMDIRKISNEDETENAVNPSHYNVPGVQQPIDVMRKLFSKEQLEGFLWGNIIKYAHRYGRKGSKKDTAGKIEQYAKWLKELGEE